MDINDVDTDGKATGLASEAQVALETGETIRAQALFDEAGNLLAAKVPLLTKPSGKNVCRLLAATQYFKGGLYQKAQKLCDRIEQARLPRRFRSVLQSFKKDLSARSASDYNKTWAQAFKAEYAVKLSEEGLRRHLTVPGLDQRLLELRAAGLNLLRMEEHAILQTQLPEDELQEMGAMMTEVTNSVKINKEYKVELASSLMADALQVA